MIRNLRERARKSSRKGFTLIELIIVIVILVILAAIAIPAVMNYVSQANDSKMISNARSTYGALCVEIANQITQGNVPTTTNVLPATVIANAGVSGTYTCTIGTNGVVSAFEYTEGSIVIQRAADNQFKKKP